MNGAAFGLGLTFYRKEMFPFRFTKYGFFISFRSISFRKVQIFHFVLSHFVSQSTDFSFRFVPFHFVPFRFAKYNKPLLKATDVRKNSLQLKIKNVLQYKAGTTGSTDDLYGQ